MLKQTPTHIPGNYWHFTCPVGLSNVSAGLGMRH